MRASAYNVSFTNGMGVHTEPFRNYKTLGDGKEVQDEDLTINKHDTKPDQRPDKRNKTTSMQTPE
jgi:hypothetical protein